MDAGIRSRLGLPFPDPDKPLRDLRVFGFCLAAIETLLALLSWRRGSTAAPWEAGLAALLSLLAGFAPKTFEPIYKPWMKITGLIGRFNTWLLAGLVYFLIITPYGLIIRLLGLDLLDEKLRDRESYWRLKGPPPSPESYRNQF